MAATARQIEIYYLHRDVCTDNGHPQVSFLHRKSEGVLTPVPGFPNNMDYSEPGARSIDSPTQTSVALWATWEPLQLRGATQDAGDTESGKMWQMRSKFQCPAIDDNFATVVMQDEDYISDPQGNRFRLENPVLSPDGAFWTAIATV